MRLDKFLHDQGLGSRKELLGHLRAGRVTVNGETVRKKDVAVYPQDVISFDGTPLVWPDARALFAMYKPGAVVTALCDRHKDTVADFIPEKWRHLHLRPVGRLDQDTTGLLLFSADGMLIHRLTSPNYHIQKVYDVAYSGTLAADAVQVLREGLVLDGRRTRPAQLALVGEGRARLVICEGIHHQVKRMIHAVGGEVTALCRVAVGPLNLADFSPPLAPGDMVRLSDSVRDQMYAAAHLS